MTRKRILILITSVSLNVLFFLYFINSYRMRKLYDVHMIQRRLLELRFEDNFNRTRATVRSRGSFECFNKGYDYRITQEGNYIVLNNYRIPLVRFDCNESVTYTTHSDYTYMDDLATLAERWKGPVSIALYAPGQDFPVTVKSVEYLRRCGPPEVRYFVAFHIYFRSIDIPQRIPKPFEVDAMRVDCFSAPPFAKTRKRYTYRYEKGIPYAVNVGRNVARTNALTHYVLPSDIELFPNPGLIDKFLDFVTSEKHKQNKNGKKVYTMPVFEIKSGMKIPDNKTALVRMIREGNAQIFHKSICSYCHKIPRFERWLMQEETEGLGVVHVAKRQGSFAEWEPIYIGTNDEPLYDERLTWEGKRDKMTQGYIMCILDYEFHILDNAFLTHKPGIKKTENDVLRDYIVRKAYSKITSEIVPEIHIMYGSREGCRI